jgi:hypothetical protein
MIVHHRLRFCSFIAAVILHGAEAPKPSPPAWETCSIAEGKGNDCISGDPVQKFEEYLKIGRWTERPGDWFSAEFKWDVKDIGERNVKISWTELGSIRSHKIRHVRFQQGDHAFAGLLLMERASGDFSALMKWAGDMPQPAIFDASGTEVLVLEKDFGGNMPMVITWAWIWHRNGPVRLDVDSAWCSATIRLPG